MPLLLLPTKAVPEATPRTAANSPASAQPSLSNSCTSVARSLPKRRPPVVLPETGSATCISGLREIKSSWLLLATNPVEDHTPLDQVQCQHRRLANLGLTACRSQVGVAPFTERYRDTHDYARRHARLPEQLPGDALDYRSLLHRDGSVLSALNLQV